VQPGADPEGGCIPLHQHMADFFLATKYRQSLGYLMQRPMNNSIGMRIGLYFGLPLQVPTYFQKIKNYFCLKSSLHRFWSRGTLHASE